MSTEQLIKAKIVQLILFKKPEEALKVLSQHYNIAVPKLRVGMPKGHRKDVGCYVAKNKTIYTSNQDGLYNPHVILHEFYHHLRTHNREHRGTEKYADKFAREYIKAYKTMSALTSTPK